MLILVLLCENECQRWDASRYTWKRCASLRAFMYRDASHLWHSFSHNRTKINIQFLNDFRWMDMLDFICNDSVDLFGTGRERKNQNENICLQWDSNPHHASPRQESQRIRPLGHEGLMVIRGLMYYRIMGYNFLKTVSWQHVSTWLWLHVYLNWMSD